MNTREKSALLALLIAAALAGGCKAGSMPEGAGGPESAADCAGATAAEAARAYHPRIIRGRVLAPSGKLAWRSPVGSWLVDSAHAAPLEKEQTVAQTSVALYRVGPSGEQTGDVLRTTETDATGQWCMKLAEGLELGADVMLEASADDVRLRRSLVSQFSTDLYSATEALTRLVQAHEVDFTKIPDQTYLNMEAIADTRIDLLDPVEVEPADTVESTVAKIRKALAKDDRLMEKIEGLSTRR